MRNFTLILISSFMLFSCVHSDYARQQKEAYERRVSVYQQAVSAMALQPPMVQLDLHENGTVKSLTVSHKMEYPNIANYKPTPHPGWKLGSALIRTAGTLGGIALVGDALSSIVDGAGDKYSGNFDSSFNRDNTSSVIGGNGIAMDQNNGRAGYIGSSEGSDHSDNSNNDNSRRNDNRDYGPEEPEEPEEPPEDDPEIPEPPEEPEEPEE